jgi:hypothetical protein
MWIKQFRIPENISVVFVHVKELCSVSLFIEFSRIWRLVGTYQSKHYLQKMNEIFRAGFEKIKNPLQTTFFSTLTSISSTIFILHKEKPT